MSERKWRVVIVDDSALVRRVLSDAIASAPDLEVVGTAPDAVVAQRLLTELKPDVITLDVEMPGMDGITFLRKMMAGPRPVPAIIVSSLALAGCRTALEALEAGAVDLVAKPGKLSSLADLRSDLINKVRAAAQARITTLPVPAVRPAPKKELPLPPRVGSFPPVVVAIGASTGGTEAIRQVLQDLPALTPPIVIVQHIPPHFSKAFANRLDQLCAMRVKEAEEGDALAPGLVLIAPGDFHMSVEENGRGLFVRLTQTEKVCYQRPAVDVLFNSMARLKRSRCVGVVLTGMGSDGAEGLARMRKAGARTLVQDEATSVVYGMPRQALLAGGAERSAPLGQIGRLMLTVASSTSPSLASVS
ncbi:MAG: chemotaxis response regulator protein-glutamate methylesterase [Bryobacteraceae bacterium]|nr:chemotaxis response regulator protein-glutamate methylesterase [Bryobacteraceae bacterium]